MRFFPSRRGLRALKRSPRVFIPAPAGRQIVVPFRPVSTLLIVALVFLSIFLALRSDIFQVKALEFELEEVSDEALVRQRVMEEVMGRSIFFLNASKVEDSIKSDFPTIKEVTLEKRLPDKLVIRISVRVPLAVVEDKDGDRFQVDQGGFLFKESGQENLPVIKLGVDFDGAVGLSVSDKGVCSYLETLDLATQKGFGVRAIYLNSTSIELRLDGTVVWLSAEAEISSQLELLTNLLQRYKLGGTTPKSVDLRFSRPVVRL